MARQIYEVNATQVVVSTAHPEGIRSAVSGYPKSFDSNSYNGSEETALIVAQAEYADTIKTLTLAGNRAMWTVTLERADGRQIDRKSVGAFPVVDAE